MTSVGATEGLNPEVAAPFSSGGFSEVFPRPAYQDVVVGKYLDSLGDRYQCRYNPSGRAYPDVSAHGVDFAVKLGDHELSSLGTSAAAPTFASIVALLNDRLLDAGEKPLGFLNPLLYATLRDAFTDITSGNNPGCGTEGFQADVGWDPVRVVIILAITKNDAYSHV